MKLNILLHAINSIRIWLLKWDKKIIFVQIIIEHFTKDVYYVLLKCGSFNKNQIHNPVSRKLCLCAIN